MAEDFKASNWWNITRNSAAAATTSGFDGTAEVTSIGHPPVDPTLQLSGFGLLSPTMDWTQTILNNSGRTESNFQGMLNEDLNSSSSFSQRDMNHPFFYDNSMLSGTCYPLACSSSSSSMLMQGFIEQDSKPDQSFFDTEKDIVHYLPKQQSGMINHLHYSNHTPFWSDNSASPDLPMKSLDGGREGKSFSSEHHAMKKIRVDTHSPLPAFKVRKEKLGDRITALQQLVSPFGKTDTASVLHEAIEYIKFLHEQVNVLSTPYLKTGHPMQQQLQVSEKEKRDLRSRGLCLVPIASTYPMAGETSNADFWTPTFGGTYR